MAVAYDEDVIYAIDSKLGLIDLLFL